MFIADGHLACLADTTVRYCTLPGGSCAETRNNDMYKYILIATDGSDLSANVVKQGVTLAKTLAAKVTAVNVSDGVGCTGRSVQTETRALASREAPLSATDKSLLNSYTPPWTVEEQDAGFVVPDHSGR